MESVHAGFGPPRRVAGRGAAQEKWGKPVEAFNLISLPSSVSVEHRTPLPILPYSLEPGPNVRLSPMRTVARSEVIQDSFHWRASQTRIGTSRKDQSWPEIFWIAQEMDSPFLPASRRLSNPASASSLGIFSCRELL